MISLGVFIHYFEVFWDFLTSGTQYGNTGFTLALNSCILFSVTLEELCQVWVDDSVDIIWVIQFRLRGIKRSGHTTVSKGPTKRVWDNVPYSFIQTCFLGWIRFPFDFYITDIVTLSDLMVWNKPYNTVWPMFHFSFTLSSGKLFYFSLQKYIYIYRKS